MNGWLLRGFAYKLLEDHEGNIWVGCAKGLVHSVTSSCSGESRTLSKLVFGSREQRRDLGRNHNNKPLLHVAETVCLLKDWVNRHQRLSRLKR